MKRSKEYFLGIGRGSDGDDIVWREDPLIDGAIHVIEYGEYQRLKTQNEIMRVALEFYASARNVVLTFKEGKHDRHDVDK